MFFRKFSVFLPTAWLAVAALGCSPAKAPEGGPSIGASETPWRDKTHEQRQGYMAAHVLPTMSRLFRSFNAKSYSDFSCETCHGKDMDLIDFKMPNGLYALPVKDPVAEAMSVDEDTAKFMVEKVLPTFAKLMHEKPNEGVTCFTCHQKE